MAPPDVARPDAPVDLDVRVHIHDPLPAGHDVLFYSPANALIATVTTANDGLATATMPDGGTVVEINGLDEVRAVFGVEPGDDIDLDTPENQPAQDPMTITVPDNPGTSVYRIGGTECGAGGSTTTSITVFVESTCQGPTDFLAQAEDSNGALLASLRGTATPLQATTFAGPWLPPETMSLSVANPPGGNVGVNRLYPIVGPRPLAFELTLAASGTRGAGNTFTYRVQPAALVDARLFEVGFAQVPSVQIYDAVLSPATTSITFDGAVEGLPFYIVPTGGLGAMYDPAMRTITVARGPGAAFDGQLVSLQFRNDVMPAKAWNVRMPPDANTVTLPVLPSTYQSYDPSDPTITIRQVVPSAVRASNYHGYVDFRRGVPLPHDIGSFVYTSSVNSSSL